MLSEDDRKTAYLRAVLDRQKAQPAAARIARLKTKKDEYPRLIYSKIASRPYSWFGCAGAGFAAGLLDPLMRTATMKTGGPCFGFCFSMLMPG